MVENSSSSWPGSEIRLDQIEAAVWGEVANRQRKARHAAIAAAAVAFLAVSSFSYSLGALQGQRAELHFAMTAELLDSADLFEELAG